MWAQELVPNTGSLFYRVHIDLAPDGVLRPNVFREKGNAMSTDWDKYSTPEETRDRAPTPRKNGIVALNAGIVRLIEGITVVHTPDAIRGNRAHTEVRGMRSAEDPARKTMVREQLFRHFNAWRLQPQVLSER